MIAILFGLIALGIFSVTMLWVALKARNSAVEIASVILGLIGSVGTLFGTLVLCACAVSWFGAEHKARVINETFGTHYTQAEVFWAEDVIDEVRELRRKRIEVNGDLFREEKP